MRITLNMYVCLCEGVSERQVEGVIDAGARSVDAVGRACGAGTGCGSCKDVLRHMLRERACTSDTSDAGHAARFNEANASV